MFIVVLSSISVTVGLYLYVAIPDEWAEHAKAIRLLLGEELEISEEAMGGKEAPVDQTDNFTLKWTSKKHNLDVSLLVAVYEVVRDAVSATLCLRWYFDGNLAARLTVRETLRLLRENRVLNSHGRKASVDQFLKTASAALLCVALIQEGERRNGGKT